MRSRFLVALRLDYYDPSTLTKILLRSASLLANFLENEGALEIAETL